MNSLSPAQFKPVGRHFLVRLIDQHIATAIVLPQNAQRRNMLAVVIAIGSKYEGPVRQWDTVMVPWVFKTAEDVFFFSDDLHLVVPQSRVAAVVRGEGKHRALLPIGRKYLVRRAPQTKTDSGLLVATGPESQCLDIEIIRRGVTGPGKENAFPLEPGTIARLNGWQQHHVEVTIDRDMHALIVPESDIVYFRQPEPTP